MTHHRKDLIEVLLNELDDIRNDIYLHIDSRSDIRFEDFHVSKSNLYKVEQMEVNWGGYSIIECEIRILKQALHNGPYSYYHMLFGSCFPLRSQNYLHDFYDSLQGKQFIEYDEEIQKDRVEQIFLFNEHIKRNRLLHNISILFIKLQKSLGYNHFRQFNMTYKKGFALWSITDELARYILDNTNLIYKMFKHSYCADEVYMQTIVYNSKFKDQLYINSDNKYSSMWISTWDIYKPRIANNFELDDYDYLMDSKANFARKFEGQDGIELINRIKETFK